MFYNSIFHRFTSYFVNISYNSRDVIYINEFPVCCFVLGCIYCSCKSSLIPGMLYSWDLVLTVNSLIYCSNVQFLYSLKSVPLLFHCFRNYLWSDRHTHRRTDVLEIILIRNLLMVNHTVVIASVTSLCNMMFYI